MSDLLNSLPLRPLSTLPSSILLFTLPLLLILTTLATVRIYTTLRYRLSLSSSLSTSISSQKPAPTSPPQIPYTLPWLGHALSFLAPHPGLFWSRLFTSHPRSTGACTLLLGGTKTHILFSPTAVEGLFKARKPGRDGFNLQICVNGLGVEYKEAVRYFGIGEGKDEVTGLTPVQEQERVNHVFLMEKKSVNELTGEFLRVLKGVLGVDFRAGMERGGEVKEGYGEGCGEGDEVDLYKWLQDRMFTASTTAFLGSRLLELYPDLCKDFFDFDRHMLTMFFRVPKLLNPTPYRVREKALAGLIAWHEQMQKECKSEPADPDGDIDWEPVYGSRANRARQRYYASRGLNLRTRAGMDLGLLFGLSSNAIPATGWMLMHILDPAADKTLLGRVMEEVKRAERDDGSVDVPTLIALPLMQSIFNEVLRLYVDVLVTREMKEDLTLPLDANGRRVALHKDDVVMAPSWLGHRDEAIWTEPPCNQFYAERFLTTDVGTGQKIFSTSGTAGKLFPFGGGKTICPGRVFAKQEVLASVALVLLSFEITPLGYVDEKGKSTKVFPGLRSSYSGSGIMATDGDMRVKIKRRDEKS